MDNQGVPVDAQEIENQGDPVDAQEIENQEDPVDAQEIENQGDGVYIQESDNPGNPVDVQKSDNPGDGVHVQGILPDVNFDKGQIEENDKKVSKLFQSNRNDENEIGVLSEDHPLLQKFQQSLKAHLLRVKNQLLDEISTLDHNIKTKETEREEIGAKLYDLQEEICRQNKILEDYNKQIEETREKRIKQEKDVEIMKKKYEEKLNMGKDSKRLYNERLMELNNLQNLELNIQKWAKEINDEVATAKRVVSKDYKDQRAISEDKKKFDLFLFNLETEIEKRKHELESINSQISDQNIKLESLHTSLSDATSDLEALQHEQKRLTQAWGEVIIAIQHRDKVLYQVKEESRAAWDKHTVLCANVEGIKKDVDKEIGKNEKLESFKMRLEQNLANLKKQVIKENTALNKLEEKTAAVSALVEQTETDYEQARKEANTLEVQLKSIRDQINKQATKKLELENKLLELTQEQITSDKATNYRMKLLSEAQVTRRKLELNLSQCEIQVSNVLLEMEKCKGNLITLREKSEEYTKKHEEANNELDMITKDIKASEWNISLKTKQIEQISEKLDAIIQARGGQEGSPIDLEIEGLEKHIQSTEQEIRHLQQFWLALQSRVVKLTEKRNAQLNEIQMARKQIMIIDQKTLKVNLELDNVLNQGRELDRTYTKLTKTLDLLGTKLFEKKKSHENEETESSYMHSELMDKLKDAEMSVLRVEQEITDLNREIEELKQTVLERHREALSWETKYKMIEEMIRWRKTEKGNESEIAHMKTEIRRMEVRYNQLKRAQEKLVQDLEHCVMHREKIFTSAMTRQKLDGNQSRTKTTVQHKLQEMKNKIRIINNEISNAEKRLADVNAQYELLQQEISKIETEINNEIAQDKLIENEIEQGLLMKHQNLENIVRKQHRAKRYRALCASKVLPKLKQEATIDTNMSKQLEIHENLIDIVQNLISGFPDKKFYLTRVLQTLKDDQDVS